MGFAIDDHFKLSHGLALLLRALGSLALVQLIALVSFWD